MKESAVDQKEDPAIKKKWVDLLTRYLFVYLLATCSDWLQGPYVYALYRDYGYQQHDIAVLFVAGFGSAMVFGTFIGGMADQFGRRLFVVVYGLSYALSCFTKRKHTRKLSCQAVVYLFFPSISPISYCRFFFQTTHTHRL